MSQYPVAGKVKTPLDSVIAAPRLPYPDVSLTSRFDAIGSAAPAKLVVSLHALAWVKPPAGNPVVVAPVRCQSQHQMELLRYHQLPSK